MALVTLAVVGEGNIPLYLRDIEEKEDSSLLYSERPADGEESFTLPAIDSKNGLEEEKEDPFGFCESNKVSKPNDSSSLKHQFVIHSALDRFDELIQPELIKSRAEITPNSMMFIGLLGCYDELRVYGYYTSTKIKFMAAVQDNIQDETQLCFRESGLKVLFASMHELYVEYNLNPFSSIRENKKINSRRFDGGVLELVETFNETYGKKGMSWM